MSGLSRDNENWRNSLLKRQNEPDGNPLTEAEELWLSVLNDRYEKFLEEGLQAMKSQLPSSKGGPTFASGVKESVSSLFSKIGKGMKFASLSPEASPSGDSFTADLGDVEPPHSSAKHWSWVIKDRLIVGGVPLADPMVTDPSGHIRGVKGQCKERNVKIGLVVSCIDTIEELSKPGDRLESFAKPKDWEKYLGVSCFAELSLPEDLGAMVEVPPSDTLSVCRMMNDVMVANRAVFLHCKAGKNRCWGIAMCFLITQRGMSFDQAQEWLRKMRPQMQGGALHALYVQQVADYAAANPQPEKGSINNVFQQLNPSPLYNNSSSPQTTGTPFVGFSSNTYNNAAENDDENSLQQNDDDDSMASPITAAQQRERNKSQSPSKQIQEKPPGVSDETDAKYKTLLADLLQLPPYYRIKIVEDLQRLT